MTNLIDFLYGKTREFAGNIQVNLNALIKGKLQVDDTADATTTTDGAGYIKGGLSVAKNAVVGGDIYTTAYTDYSATSTVTGWSSTTVKQIWYKKVGKIAYVWWEITGTSNSTITTFTLPVTCVASGQRPETITMSQDNTGTFTGGRARQDLDTAIVTLSHNFGNANYTDSGTKSSRGTLIVPIQ